MVPALFVQLNNNSSLVSVCGTLNVKLQATGFLSFGKSPLPSGGFPEKFSTQQSWLHTFTLFPCKWERRETHAPPIIRARAASA